MRVSLTPSGRLKRNRIGRRCLDTMFDLDFEAEFRATMDLGGWQRSPGLERYEAVFRDDQTNATSCKS